jgi:flagellar assembly factor FliW
MMAEQFEMVQYIDIVTQNLICVILRENQHQCTIKKLKKCKPRTAMQSIGPQTKFIIHRPFASVSLYSSIRYI